MRWEKGWREAPGMRAKTAKCSGGDEGARASRSRRAGTVRGDRATLTAPPGWIALLPRQTGLSGSAPRAASPAHTHRQVQPVVAPCAASAAACAGPSRSAGSSTPSSLSLGVLSASSSNVPGGPRMAIAPPFQRSPAPRHSPNCRRILSTWVGARVTGVGGFGNGSAKSTVSDSDTVAVVSRRPPPTSLPGPVGAPASPPTPLPAPALAAAGTPRQRPGCSPAR